MLQAVKRLVGAARGEDHDSAIDAASEKLEKARRALVTEQGKLQTTENAVVEAQAAFDADPSDAHADAVIAARSKRDRAALFTERAAKVVDAAAEAVAQAERARDEHLLALAKDRCDDGAHERELAALVESRGPELVKLAAELHDAAVEMEWRGRQARREKLALEQRLGLDTRQTELAILGEQLGGLSAGALATSRLASRLKAVIRARELGREKTQWLTEIG
jgi:hypothetical protein